MYYTDPEVTSGLQNKKEKKKKKCCWVSVKRPQVTSFWPMRRKQHSAGRIWECFRFPAKKGGLGLIAALPPTPWVECGCVWNNSSCLVTIRQQVSSDILELLNQCRQFLHLLFCAKKKKSKSFFSKTTKFSLLWYCKHLKLLQSFRITVIITLNLWISDFRDVWSKPLLREPSGK